MSVFKRKTKADPTATPPLHAAGKVFRWQQGDVTGELVEGLPAGAKLRRDGILAHGETTGHAHRLAEATDGLLYEGPDGTLYVKAGPRGATITHEEHGPIVVPADSIYRVGAVQEYDHFLEDTRRVVD